MRIIDQDLVVLIVLFCLKKSWKNALHQWRNPRPSQGSFLWLSDLFASGYIISVFDISVKHKFNTFCYQNFSTLIVKAYFCSSSCLLFLSADMKEQFLYYMLLKRRTDKPKIKTFQIALHAYKRVTQHMGTPLSDIYISFRKSKGFNLRSLTPKISICHGSFLLFMILVCFWPVLKHRWTNIEGIVFPAKLHITHSELFRLFAFFKRVLVARAKGSFAGFTEKFHSWYFFLSFIDNWQK